jgi:hypothetical protein
MRLSRVLFAVAGPRCAFGLTYWVDQSCVVAGVVPAIDEAIQVIAPIAADRTGLLGSPSTAFLLAQYFKTSYAEPQYIAKIQSMAALKTQLLNHT